MPFPYTFPFEFAISWASWTDWGVDAYAVAICSYGAKVFAFRIDASDGHLYRSESTDSGATWGAWHDMGFVSGNEDFRLAACFKSDTEAILLYSNGADIYRSRWDDVGGWEAFAAWTNTLNSVTGISVVYMGDWNVIITGTEETTANPGVWTCIYGDGYSAAVGTWSPLKELTIASAGSNIEFHAPSLLFPDVFRAFFVEKYSGAEAYSRPYWSHSLAMANFTSNLWREPVPFNLANNHDLALAEHSPDAWLTRPDGVWRASLVPANVNVTADVLEVKAITRPFSGGVEVTLRNDDGRYNAIGSGTYAAIKKGSEILLSFGYRTTAGAETGGLEPISWIEGWEYVTEGGHSALVIHGQDGWSLLDKWRARRQFTWAQGEKNIFQLLALLFGRAGLECSAFSTSSAVVSQYPAFTIHPRESGTAAVRRLLNMVPDVLFFVRDCGYLKNPSADEGSVYSYGTDHAILEGRYAQNAPAINRAQVYGDGVVTEDWGWGEIELVYDRLAQANDINLDSATKAHQRGEAMLREAERGAVAGHIVVPMNCGQDLFDVIAITSPQAGLNASKRRALALTHSWLPSKAKYTLTIGFGAV